MGARAGNICRQRLPGTHQIGCRHLGIGTKARRARRHGPFGKRPILSRTSARCTLAAPFAAEELGSCRTVYTLSKLPRAKPCLTSHTWQAWNSWHAFLMQARSPGHPAQKRLGPNGRIWVPPRNPPNRDGAAPIAAELPGSCRTIYKFPRLSRGPTKMEPRPTTHVFDHDTAAAFAGASLRSTRTVYTPLKLTRGPTSGVSP